MSLADPNLCHFPLYFQRTRNGKNVAWATRFFASHNSLRNLRKFSLYIRELTNPHFCGQHIATQTFVVRLECHRYFEARERVFMASQVQQNMPPTDVSVGVVRLASNRSVVARKLVL